MIGGGMKLSIKGWTFVILLAFFLIKMFVTDDFNKSENNPSKSVQEAALSIVAGSESKNIENIITSCAEKAGVAVSMSYSGSVDMMLDMKKKDFSPDAVLPASSIWLRLGDQEFHRVKDEASIMRSPVALGIKKPLAQSLGWVGADVTVSDILNAVESGRFHFAMTSATQSNSGFSSYMGMLVALAGKPDVLTKENLDDPGLRKNIKKLLNGVNRGSGSSGWLMEMFVKDYDKLDAMFNYESMIIAANQELIRAGKDPLYIVYPVDGLAVADSTLGFVSKPENPDNAKKEEAFIRLRDCLLGDDAGNRIIKTGFRAGLIGMNPDGAPKDVYNPDWGIDLGRTISPVVWPDADVTVKALNLYQTVFRKPSFTVFAVDCSGSMKGRGLLDLKAALDNLFDPERSGQYLIQTGGGDITVIIPFDHDHLWSEPLVIKGNEKKDLDVLIYKINGLETRGGTNIYLPIADSWNIFGSYGNDLYNYLPSVILMTDGKSNNGSLDQLMDYWRSLHAGFDIPPVFCIMYGDADDGQLKAIADATSGRVFDGRSGGLEKAFRNAKGYN